MNLNLTVTLNGVRMGEKKDGTKFYSADLYADGVGAFDKSISPDEYVRLAPLRLQTLTLSARLSVQSQTIQTAGGRSFTVQRLGVILGDISLPENARKSA